MRLPMFPKLVPEPEHRCKSRGRDPIVALSPSKDAPP